MAKPSTAPSQLSTLIGPRRGVITGDIVGSSQLDPDGRARLFQVMQQGSAELLEVMPDAIPLPMDIFSGDTWQLLLTRCEMSLRAALFYRSYLLANIEGVDTRAVIAIGSVEHVPSDRVSQSEGEAFRLSGRTLRELKDGTRMRFRCEEEALERPWDSVAELLDTVIQREWTASRARAVTGALRGWKQEQIAGLWPSRIAQASVSENLSGAAWPVVERAIEHFEHVWRS